MGRVLPFGSERNQAKPRKKSKAKGRKGRPGLAPVGDSKTGRVKGIDYPNSSSFNDENGCGCFSENVEV